MPQRLALLTVIATLLAHAAAAQTFEIGPHIGYRFGGEVQDRGSGEVGLESAVTFGAIANVDFRRDLGLQLLWSHQNSEISLVTVERAPIDVKVDYWLVGPVKVFRPERKFRPTASLLLGLTHFSTNVEGAASSNWFSLAAGVGGIYYPTRRIGLRFDARGHFTITNGAAGFICPLPTNCIVTFPGDLFYQTELSAGVVVGLGKL